MFGERQRSALVGAIVNISLFFIKLAGGFIGRSSALLADALDSLTDMVGDVIVVGGTWFAEKPADRSHQYGHYKAESLVTAVVGLIIIGSAAAMLIHGVLKIGKVSAVPELWTLFVALTSIVVNILLYFYLHRKSQKFFSPALDAAALHKLSDAFTSVAAFVGIAAAVLFGIGWADSAASIVVAIWVIRTGMVIVFRGGHELLDGAPSADVEKTAYKIISQTAGVSRVVALRMRSAGGKIFTETDIAVAKELAIEEGHTVAHRVRDELMKNIPNLADVVVHIEPSSRDESIKGKISKRAVEIISSRSGILSFHGIAILSSEQGYILAVDIVVSPDISVRAAHDIADALRNDLLTEINLADAIIHIDYKKD